MGTCTSWVHSSIGAIIHTSLCFNFPKYVNKTHVGSDGIGLWVLGVLGDSWPFVGTPAYP